MVRLFILLLTLSLSVVFLFFSKTKRIGFAFSEVELTLDTWVWMLSEHLVIVGLSVVLFLQERVYRKAIAVFLGLQGIDTIGWILFYEDPLKGWPVSFNQLKILVFSLGIINEMNLWPTKNRK